MKETGKKKEFYTYGIKAGQAYVLLGIIPVMGGSAQELDLRRDVQKEVLRVFPEFGQPGAEFNLTSLRGIRLTPRQVRALAWGFLNIIENLEEKKGEINEKRVWAPGVDHYAALQQLAEALDIWKHIRPLIRPESYPEAEWELEDTFQEPPAPAESSKAQDEAKAPEAAPEAAKEVQPAAT